MPDTPLAIHLADWSSQKRLDAVPASALHSARRAILDTTGVIVAGAGHPGVRALAVHISTVTGPCLAATGVATDPVAAATINGMAAHAWDFDDNSYTGMIHGSAIVLPAVLAVAQSVGAGEDDLLLAFLVGSEVAYVLGEVCTHSHFLHGWWATGSCGLIGATVGVAKLLGLDADQTANALGTAAVTAGIERAIAGTDAKPYLVGNVAGQAITLARAAQAGLTGPKDAFEQRNGFFALLNQGHSDVSKRTGLGQRWRIEEPGLLFKTNPVCSGAHAAIEATNIVLGTEARTPDDIETVVAEVPKIVEASLVYDRPRNAQEAQFSLPYAVACAALHGRVRLADLEPDEIAAPSKHALMDKVTMRASPDLSAEPMASRFPESTRITIRFRDGETRTHLCEEAIGMPNRPLSDADLVDKFNACLRFAGLPDEDVDLTRTDLAALAARVIGATGEPLT